MDACDRMCSVYLLTLHYGHAHSVDVPLLRAIDHAILSLFVKLDGPICGVDKWGPHDDQGILLNAE